MPDGNVFFWGFLLLFIHFAHFTTGAHFCGPLLPKTGKTATLVLGTVISVTSATSKLLVP